MNNVTVLFPGGFKPITGAHMQLAQRYASNPQVKRVIMLCGPKTRDGITRDNSRQIFELLNSDSKIEFQPTEFNSPLTAAYEFLFALPETETGTYALAASNKDLDYVRVKDFVPNVDKYKTVGDRNGRTMPEGIDATELMVDIDPLTTANGEAISASRTRADLSNYNSFKQSYPQYSDAIVKNVFQILNGTQEQSLTKEWWISKLQEDIDAIIEGYIDTKTADKHQKKIAKLKKFLKDNPGKEFVYDFDEYEKTTYGVKLLESKINENYITRTELAQIEPVIDGFFKRYDIDVDFQGKFTHFIERLNDPRNEGTITLDDLENLFRDLADEYGEDIANQLREKRPSAVASDYQFDVPLHMPFQLEFNPTLGQIQLIPRTIKAQRKRWQSNNPADKIYTIESKKSNSYLLTEGGLGGHMNHPYDTHGLTFNDMKEIISRSLSGRLDIEQAVTEKTDGQNIFVTYKDGQVGFARNKGERINPLSVTELQEKFGGRGALSDAFGEAGNDLNAALSKLNAERLNDIFKNGRVFANMEIIYPQTKNIIAYEDAYLQFHNLTEFDDNGDIVMTDMPGGAILQRAIQDANAHLQNTFKIIPPQKLKIGRIDDFEDYQDALYKEVDQLKNKYGLKETDLVSEYHKAWWADVIKTKAEQLNYSIPDSVLNTLVNRWAFENKSTRINNLVKDIDNTEFANWVTEFDKKDFKQYQKQNIQPFETIFLKLGATVLKNASEFLALNPNNTVQDIRKELANTIRILKQTDDASQLSALERQLGRIQQLGGFGTIVPLEGIVFVYKGNTYKLTGSFAPVNQILGMVRYQR